MKFIVPLWDLAAVGLCPTRSAESWEQDEEQQQASVVLKEVSACGATGDGDDAAASSAAAAVRVTLLAGVGNSVCVGVALETPRDVAAVGDAVVIAISRRLARVRHPVVVAVCLTGVRDAVAVAVVALELAFVRDAIHVAVK